MNTVSSPEESPFSRIPLLVVAAALLLVSALHYGTPRGPSYHALHDVWRRLYYVPIVLGAFHYGLRGGVLTALAATVLYLPHVLFQWGSMAGDDRYLEIVMFNVIGFVTGLLAEELHHQREEAKRAYRRLAESFERTKEAERLAAMGQLSASLAHEIRNPLSSLKGSMPILLRGIEKDDPRQEFAEIVEKELNRLEDLTGEFLEYARPPLPRLADDELSGVVAGVMRLVEKEAQRNQVEIRVESAEGLPLLKMDSGRMRQVVLNLMLNAIEAMPKGGVLRLRTTRGSGPPPLGPCVVLEVEDNGPGISPEVAEHLFEPFVSTKEKGTGLGLAVAHAWVMRHGGSLDVGSSELGGACFTICLPIDRPFSSQQAENKDAL